jgi:hypothetical protein
MLDFQQRIEREEGPFFLSAGEIAQKKLEDKLMIYQLKQQY